jgi:glycosyltransferase involved in cell wall biosynthesis
VAVTENQPLNKQLNVLMLSPTMFFADYGAHVRILEEVTTLQKFGHAITILAYPNGRDIAGIKVKRCWGVPFNYRVIVGSSRHKIYLDVLLSAMSLLHVLRHKPDVIHAHLHEGGLIGWVLSKITGAPLVFDFQGSLTSEMLDHNFIKVNSPFCKLLYWLETRIDHSADVILTSSTHSARLLAETFGVPTAKIYPTPDCVNAGTFSPESYSAQEIKALKQRLGVPLNKKIIVYLGVLAPYQGIDKLLESLAALKQTRDDFHLLLMGYPGVDKYKAISSELGVADLVSFTDKIPYQEAPRYLVLGDIATAPKMSTTEGSGKILNYMSMALPTVAFNTPVSREFLGDGGIYASEMSSQALTTALHRALDLSDEERQRVGRYLRQRVIHHFSWDDAGEQIDAIYQALVSGQPLPQTSPPSTHQQLSGNKP